MSADKLQPKVGPYYAKRSGIFIGFSDKIDKKVGELKTLAADFAGYQVRIYNVFYNRHFMTLNKRYSVLFRELMDLYGIFKKPLLEGLLKELNLSFPQDKQEITELGTDYLKHFKESFEKSFEEGFKFVEMVDKQIAFRYQRVDQNKTFLISMLAIVVTIVLKII